MSTVSPRHQRGHRRTGAALGRLAPLWWTLAALLACAVLLGVSVMGHFRVRHVVVVGATGPTTEAVVRTTGVLGSNIFAVRSDDVVHRVSTLRQVDVQRVDTSFPDRVTVYVHMRRRFLAWQDGTVLYEVDPNGRIVDQVRSTSLPIITGLAPGASLGPGIVQAVRYATDVLPRSPNGSVALFRVNPQSGLVIVGRAGWTASVGRGSPQTLVQRIASLAALLQSQKDAHGSVRSVDLRYPTPYFRRSGA